MTVTATPIALSPPLSVAQEALWYMSLLHPNEVTYNETISIRKDGEFDATAFRSAFNEIVRRHQAWHTVFDMSDGQPVQIVQPAANFELPVLDLGQLTHEQAEREAVRIMAGIASLPYDVRRGPLLRPRLLRFPGDHHRLYLALHHLIFDGMSVNRVVLPELVALYEAFRAGRPSPLADPPAQYGDYARWEQEWIAGERVARRMRHWRERLHALPGMALRSDRAPALERRFRGGVLPVSVPREVVVPLREVGRNAGSTLFQVLASIWALLLSRYSGEDEVVFGTVADLRRRPEFASIVGYCVTPVVLRVKLEEGDSFADLVVRVRNELLDGLDNLVPFERLVRELRLGSAHGNPVYQTMIVLEPQAVSAGEWSMHQMESEISDAVGNVKVDLELQLDEQPDGQIAGRMIYDRGLFERASVARMVGHWLRMLSALASEPNRPLSDVPILTPEEEHRQLVEWNATRTTRPFEALHHRLEARSRLQRSAAAISADGHTVSYAELELRANRVAAELRGAGVRADTVVAICAPASADLVAGMLGVLKLGAAYLLLDPDLPTDRLNFMLGDAAAIATLVTPALSARLDAAGAPRLRVFEASDAGANDVRIAPASPGPDATCSIHYANQATAAPIGVALRQDSAINVACALAAELGAGPDDAFLSFAPDLFRTPVIDLWLPLIVGARIVFADASLADDGARLSRVIATERVTYLHATPERWKALIDTGMKGSRGLKALSSGGPVSAALAGQILARCRVLWNLYGAAETTECCALTRVDSAAHVTLGRPIANDRVYVLDRHDQPVPVGVDGELVVAGEGIASGYLNRPDQAAHVFVNDPFGSGRAYRTGQLARWLDEGELELIARRD